MVWLDPDRPEDLCRHHRFWSSHQPALVRFRRRDYGDERTSPLGILTRDDLQPVLGHRPDGPIRMLTQVRRLGWLFNPITIYFAWDHDNPEPVGAVLEVTNTPWKERHRYAIALRPTGERGDSQFATFPKVLHVSPFLDEKMTYDFRIAGGDRLDIRLDVIEQDASHTGPVISTSLTLDRHPAERATLRRALFDLPFSTYQVSAGIHRQAARLAIKGVPFVSHPRRRDPPERLTPPPPSTQLPSTQPPSTQPPSTQPPSTQPPVPDPVATRG
jgi:DUF1365 family protein